jgi:hypothetical protein
MAGETLQQPVQKDQPITIDAIDSAYAYTAQLRDLIMRRGL